MVNAGVQRGMSACGHPKSNELNDEQFKSVEHKNRTHLVRQV
jgi:hypothetical protein